jgi:response regulator RpfG family c-di-GMP phosphodiesterase
MTHRVILVVDDERNIIKALFRLLRAPDRVLLAAQAGEEAILTLASEHVDLVISDEKMPGMSGLALLERARSLAPEAIRVLLTGFPDTALVREALGKRIAHHVVLKPWDDAALRAKVEAVLGG